MVKTTEPVTNNTTRKAFDQTNFLSEEAEIDQAESDIAESRLTPTSRRRISRDNQAIFSAYCRQYNYPPDVKELLTILIEHSDDDGNWVCGLKQMLSRICLTEDTIQEFVKSDRALNSREKSKIHRLLDKTIKYLEATGNRDFKFIRVMSGDYNFKKYSSIVSYVEGGRGHKTSGDCVGYFEFQNKVLAEARKDGRSRNKDTKVRLNCYVFHARKAMQERLGGQSVALPRKKVSQNQKPEMALRKAIARYAQLQDLDAEACDQNFYSILALIHSSATDGNAGANNPVQNSDPITKKRVSNCDTNIDETGGLGGVGDAEKGYDFRTLSYTDSYDPIEQDRINLLEVTSENTDLNYSGISQKEFNLLTPFQQTVIRHKAAVERYNLAGFDTCGVSLIKFKQNGDRYEKQSEIFAAERGFAPYSEQSTYWLSRSAAYLAGREHAEGLALIVRWKDSTRERELIQLDDVEPTLLARVRHLCFDIIETSPGNYQAMISAPAGSKSFIRRAIEGLCDVGATGAARLRGTLQNKPGRIQEDGSFFMVRSVGGIDGRRPTVEELKEAGLWKDVTSGSSPDDRILRDTSWCRIVKNPPSNKELPEYDPSNGKKMRADGSVDTSAYDFAWVLRALRRRCNETEILNFLISKRRSDQSGKRGVERYAVSQVDQAKRELNIS